MNHSTFGHGKERCERLMADVVPNLSAILHAVDWREDIEDASDKAFAVAVERLRTVVGIDINDPKYDEVFKDIIIIGERKIG